MKNIVSTLKTIGKTIVLPVLVVVALSTSSCKKEECGRPQAKPSISMDAKAKDAKLRTSVAKTLKDFVIIFNSSNTQGGGNGSNNWSNVTTNGTSYTTPNANVYQWTDPNSGTTFTMSQSISGGSGLGQLSYNGRSFDYNWVLGIKASSNDPQWSGLFGGGDLRGAVAIDGVLTSTDFSLKSLAVFLVMTSGGAGTYKFIDWTPASVGDGTAIGELLDFSDVTDNTTAGLSLAKAYITKSGHLTVSDQEFAMNSDAMVTDLVGGEYTLSGSLMFE